MRKVARSRVSLWETINF